MQMRKVNEKNLLINIMQQSYAMQLLKQLKALKLLILVL